MYFTTGFSREGIVDLCAMIHTDVMDSKRPWPPILGLYKSVIVTLTYMRRNRVQAELAETYEVSQPTISRAISGITHCWERCSGNMFRQLTTLMRDRST